MDNGWIKLYRSSIQNPAFQKPHTWHYFQYCLLKANHTDKSILWNKEEIIIERGCFITGRKEAAKETGLSQQNIRTALLTLHNLGMIEKSTIKSTSKYTYIKVCNYDTYQQQDIQSNQQINQQLTSNQPATNQQLTTNNNDKNNKNDKKLYMECVYLSDEEYEKLLSQYKEAGTKQRIENLNLYIMSKGKKYKSHYHTILSWERKNDKQYKRSPADITKENLKQFVEEMTNG